MLRLIADSVLASCVQPDMSKLSLSAGSMWEKMMEQMMPEMGKAMKFCKMLPGKGLGVCYYFIFIFVFLLFVQRVC